MNVAHEITEARVILEKGSRFEVPAPFILRLFGKKNIVLKMYDPTAAICLELTTMRLSMGITDEEFETMTIEQGLTMLQKHGKTIAKMIALGLLRTPRANQLFGKWLTKRLLANYPMSTLLDMMHILTLGSGLEDFMSTMELLKVVRLTMPNNPSHKTNRS